MRRWITRIVVMSVAMLFCTLSTAQDLPTVALVAAYTYDGELHASTPTSTTVDRPSPSSYDRFLKADADHRWSKNSSPARCLRIRLGAPKWSAAPTTPHAGVAAEAGTGVTAGIPNAARSRPGFRRGTERDALQSAPRAPDGGAMCVGCGTPLGRGQIEYGGRLRRDFDLDHYGQTWAERVRQMPHDITRPDVNDAYQLDVRALCPVCNQSHRMEGVP